jgi:N-acetylmuramoyl-L-alanine amidase
VRQKLFLNLRLSIKKLFKYAGFLVLILLPTFLTASVKKEVRDIRYWSSPDYTRVVVDLSETVKFSKNRLSNPDRIYFDLINTTISKDIKDSFTVENGMLRMVRVSQFNPDTVRVVLDIQEIADFNVFFLDNPSRLVIDIHGKEKAKKQDTETVKRRIVIDPGHGGHDPGAVGPKGLYEKDIVLDIALKLKKILKKNNIYEVFMTRETDIFIPLEERTVIANEKKADLFISIHANASPTRRAKGIETYLLNWTDDEEANQVAARENAISLEKMKEMQQRMDVLGIIMNDLIRQNKRDESIKLAHHIQSSLVSNLNNVHRNIPDLGVKWALFYVLFGAKMPSVLVEVSFISNPEEEKLLSKDVYRLQIAKSIADAIDTYFTSITPVQKVADYKNDNLN